VRESESLQDLLAPAHGPTTTPAPTPAEPTARASSPESTNTSNSSSHHSLDENGGKKPKKVHGLFQKAIGKIELGIGKITHNEHLIEKGEGLHAAGAAEIALAAQKAAGH
ncbi:hypothetical protein HK104_002369, partial [Borealophlyctis nickersoniae]